MSLEKDNQHRPQHLTTVVDDVLPSKGRWPESWKQDPEKLRLVSQHQNWLAHPVTAQLRQLLHKEKDKLSASVASQSVSGGISAEAVRVTAAQLNRTLELEKMVFNTEIFVEKVTQRQQ